MTSRMQAWIDRLLPGSCALCGDDGPGPLCPTCCDGLLQPAPRCRCCAIRLPAPSSTTLDSSIPASPIPSSTAPPSASATVCARCLRHPPPFDHSFALADYMAPLDRLLQDLKFHSQLALATAFGTLLAATISARAKIDGLDSRNTVLLAVPLSAQRLAERGFNQAHEIARPLAAAWRLPLSTALCARVRDTGAQATLPLAERQVNMRGAFAVLHPRAIVGREVLVIDDVMTTGHTLAALAVCLKRHGAVRVTNLVIARTPGR